MNSTKHDIQILSWINHKTVTQFSNDFRILIVGGWSSSTRQFNTEVKLCLRSPRIGNSSDNNIALGQSLESDPQSEPVDKTSQQTIGLRGRGSEQWLQSFNGSQAKRYTVNFHSLRPMCNGVEILAPSHIYQSFTELTQTDAMYTQDLCKSKGNF